MAVSLTIDQAHDIADLANLDHDDVRTDYSGRGMHDRTCLGFVASANELVLVGAALATVLVDQAAHDDDARDAALTEARSIADRARVDSMGTRVIVYFPGVTIGGS